MKIPQSDPKASYLAHKTGIDAAVARVLNSGWYILGQETAAFEKEFAAFLGANHAVGVASGTDALVIALRACGVGTGDAVVTVSHTAVATVAAVELAGAVPVLADIDPESFTLNPESLETTIREYLSLPAASRHTLKAVIAVHLYGQPADLPAIQRIADRYGLVLIEDCAQSHGAAHSGRMTGTWGRVGAFSFYPTKNLGAIGDGGAIVTNDSAVAARALLLREYGWQRRYVSQISGMNSRLDELQSAILRVKLPHLVSETERRRAIARCYNKRLASAAVRRPRLDAPLLNVFHQYVIRTQSRDTLRTFLQERGIGTLIHYPVPVHLQPAYAGRVWIGGGGLPHTERAACEVLSLPIHPQLSDSSVEETAVHIHEWSGTGA